MIWYLQLGGAIALIALTAFVTKTVLLKKKNTTAAPSSLDESTPFLNKQRQTVPLSEKIQLSPDTFLFRFALPTPNTRLGLPVGKHFKIYAPNKAGVVPGEWNGREDPEAGKEEIQRSYTPTTSDDDLGHFDLVIKVYKGGVIDRFPDGGKASQYIDSLNIGDTIDMAGPYGLVSYKGNGVVEYKRKQTNATQIGMIAGGTGLTPMLQVITEILKHPEDKTKISLLYANQTEADILVRETLETLQKENPDRLKVWYTLDRPGDNWEYSTGFINEEMVASHLPEASEETIILMCGPPPMIKFACVPNLTKIGHEAAKLVTF